MGLDVQAPFVPILGILGLALGGFGSCSGGGTASPDVRSDVLGSDVRSAEDLQRSDTNSPAGVFGCPEESTLPTDTQCGCLVDFNSSVLLHVSNSPTGWSEWPEGLSPYDGFSRVKWTVAIGGDEEQVVLDEPLRVADEDKVVHRMVRLAGAGKVLIRLELVDPEGEVAAEGSWERPLMPGEMWYLAWAWDHGSAWEEVMGAGNWFKFEPKVPYCPPETPECFNLWIYVYDQNPLTDDCGVLDKLVVQPWYGQSIEATAAMVEQVFSCCEPFGVTWNPNGQMILISVPKPSMYLGALFRVGCAAESGLPLAQAQTVTTCEY